MELEEEPIIRKIVLKKSDSNENGPITYEHQKKDTQLQLSVSKSITSAHVSLQVMYYLIP